MPGRVVAELGRPETESETAARKAESSRAYRSSQTFRNLIAAIIVTVVLLGAIVLIVPRGTVAQPEQKDAGAIAEALSNDLQRPVYALDEVPNGWQINGTPARTEDSGARVWKVVYAPDKDNTRDTGFVTLEQAFDADADRVAVRLAGARADGTVDIDGREWTRYAMSDSLRGQNVTYALGTVVDDDNIVLYGNATRERFAEFAEDLTAQIAATEKKATS